MFSPLVSPKDINAFPPPDPERVILQEDTTKGKKCNMPLLDYILIEGESTIYNNISNLRWELGRTERYKRIVKPCSAVGRLA